jgi:hypothetical protein
MKHRKQVYEERMSQIEEENERASMLRREKEKRMLEGF